MAFTPDIESQQLNGQSTAQRRVSEYSTKSSELWHCFYEALVLLNVLGKTRGNHSPILPESPLYTVLDCLAYIFDYQKRGRGDITTAIGFQDDPRYVFWIASNKPNSSAKNKEFLKQVLKNIRRIIKKSECWRAEAMNLENLCLRHAEKRIRLGVKLLHARIKRFKPRTPQDKRIETWLHKFFGLDAFHICSLASDVRHDPTMRELQVIPDIASEQHSNSGRTLGEVRHYLGRLAHHIWAPKRLWVTFLQHPHLSTC
ncbi:hypothetical protein F5Y18DRAFT_437848 [Xylariaceae sp. FL1019]|nr:hypothetical protein F5Y18DRAFT_437848 [Xylariaceae sp. FL1019]